MKQTESGKIYQTKKWFIRVLMAAQVFVGVFAAVLTVLLLVSQMRM